MSIDNESEIETAMDATADTITKTDTEAEAGSKQDAIKRLFSSKAYIGKDTLQDLCAAGMLTASQAVNIYVFYQIGYHQREGRTFYEGEGKLGVTFGISKDTVRSAIARGGIVMRKGKNGQRKRPWGLRRRDAKCSSHGGTDPNAMCSTHPDAGSIGHRGADSSTDPDDMCTTPTRDKHLNETIRENEEVKAEASSSFSTPSVRDQDHNQGNQASVLSGSKISIIASGSSPKQNTPPPPPPPDLSDPLAFATYYHQQLRANGFTPPTNDLERDALYVQTAVKKGCAYLNTEQRRKWVAYYIAMLKGTKTYVGLELYMTSFLGSEGKYDWWRREQEREQQRELQRLCDERREREEQAAAICKKAAVCLKEQNDEAKRRMEQLVTPTDLNSCAFTTYFKSLLDAISNLIDSPLEMATENGQDEQDEMRQLLMAFQNQMPADLAISIIPPLFRHMVLHVAGHSLKRGSCRVEVSAIRDLMPQVTQEIIQKTIHRYATPPPVEVDSPHPQQDDSYLSKIWSFRE